MLASGLVYLDSAAKSLTPTTVLDAVAAYYRDCDANPDRGVHQLSRMAGALVEEARGRVASLVGASPEEVVIVRGATEAIAMVAGGLDWQPGDRVVTTMAEHHSNYLPWLRLAAETGAGVELVRPLDDGSLPLDRVEAALRRPRCRLIAFTHVSNALGTIQPAADICRMARAAGVASLVDAAQAVPHLPVNVRALGCDYLAWSGHKMFAPTGTGALWARRELLVRMRPPAVGGGAVASVTPGSYTLRRDPPYRALEPGTRDVGGLIGFGEASRLLMEWRKDPELASRANGLAALAATELARIPGVWVTGPHEPTRRAAVVSFGIEGLSPHQAAAALDDRGVLVRSGDHCAAPLLHEVLQHSQGTVRASFHLYSNEDDVKALVGAVRELAV